MTETSIQFLMELMERSFQPDRAAGIDATIQVNLAGQKGGSWIVRIKDQQCKAEPGETENANLTMEAEAQDILDIFDGKMDPFRAYMQGKLRMNGDRTMAMKITTLFSLSKQNLK